MTPTPKVDIPQIVDLGVKLAPSIIGLISGLVKKKAPVIELIHGPGTGPVKKAELINFVMSKLQEALAAGSISGLPAQVIVDLIVETVVTVMKQNGTLEPPPAPPQPGDSAQSITLHAGQTLSINVV